MQDLINHVERSLHFGEKEVSKLTEEIMQIDGLTSRKVKSFLNNLCGLEGSSYLEFGTYKGATFCAAIYNNDIKSTAVDNWKDFELLPASFPMWHRSVEPKSNPYEIFLKNIRKCGIDSIEIINQNYLSLVKDSIKTKSNIIFYDGEHQFKDQYAIMSKLKDFSSDTFVLVIDDWNWEKRGILKGIQDFNYKQLYKKEIFTKGEDSKNFWNGLGIFILSNI
jgi:hypothetical protein